MAERPRANELLGAVGKSHARAVYAAGPL
jgi:hypothetical protein